MAASQEALALRARLARARLMLVFTPAACGARDPLGVLEAVLPEVDVVQVRPKAHHGRHALDAPCAAAETREWCLRALELAARLSRPGPLVLVDDRVDVAACLLERGCAGVHLGQEDLRAGAARRLLGRAPLIGLSTHDLGQVVAAEGQPVSYLGFGPVHGTGTKGYTSGLGAEAAWIASRASSFPVFAIGGVGPGNVRELARVGRVAVGSAILSAPDPARAARETRAGLGA